MENSIKYIRVGEGDEQTGIKPALCFRGSKCAYALLNDETCVRAVVITLQTYDLAAPVMQGAMPYPSPRFRAHMTEFARRKGITRRALALLNAGEALPPDATLPEDENGTLEAPATPTAEKAPKEDPKPAAVAPQSAKARRSAKPAPVPAPKAPKAPKETKNTAEIKLNNVAKLAAELGLEPVALRVKLRAAGMHAPYDDIKAMRKALK